MTADEAWIVVQSAMDASNERFVFGYRVDDPNLMMWCITCDTHEPVSIQLQTPETLRAAIAAFEDRHVRSCADHIESTRARLQSMARGTSAHSWTGATKTKKYDT